ncbi:MAG: hypothetical protein NDI81_15785 [Desulfobacula sp.]|nr:hypothetical protein [Desulfobacula sp.]
MEIKEINKSVILVGSFNPAIFQPTWIDHYGLMPEEEMEGFYKEEVTEEILPNNPGLKIQIAKGQPFQVNNEQAVMGFKSFSLQITRDRFAVIIFNEGKSLALRFIQKVFKILGETPISAYGINFKSHVEYKKSYDQVISNFFIPKQQFTDSFGEYVSLGFNFKLQYKDFLLTNTIEPSTKIKNGLYLATNFHKNIIGNAKKFNEYNVKNEFSETENYYLNSIMHVLDQ